MRIYAAFIGSLLALASLESCGVKTRLPIQESKLHLAVPTAELVCRVREAAKETNLSFHYGTFQQSFGTESTFRLIGDGFEITLYNPEHQTEYILGLYNMDPDKTDLSLAKATFDNLQRAILVPSRGCSSR